MNSNRIQAIIIRHLYNFRHNMDRLFDSFYWPVMDLVLWGLTSQYVQQSGKSVNNIVLVLLSGLIFWQVVWRAQYELAVNFLEEIWSQNLVNLFSTPLTLTEWTVGLILLGFGKMIMTVGLCILLTWLLYSVNLFTFGWMLVPFFASLLMVGWWVGLIVTGFIVLYGRQIQTFAWAGVYLLAPFSAIYYPVASLPGWAQSVSRLIPSSYIFEGMREVIVSGTISYPDLATSFVLNMVYLFLAMVFFRWCFAKSKEKGLARLE